MLKRALIPLVFCTLSSFNLSADERSQEAKSAFEQGRTHFNNGDFDQAAEFFNKANRLKPSWKIYFNIGQAEAAAKRYGLALTAFEKYLAMGGDEVEPKRNSEVLAELTRLRQLVGSIDIESPAGAEVMLDGILRGTTPLSGKIKVTASVEHELVLTLSGKEILRRKVAVSGGESIRVAIDDGDDVGSVEKSDAQEGGSVVNAESGATGTGKDAVNSLKIGGWIGAGVGAAVLVGGTVAGLRALSINRDLDKECETNPSCASDNTDKLDKQNALATVSTALIAAGGTIAATGAVLLILSMKQNDRRTAQLSIVPFVAEQKVGLFLKRSF